MKKHLFLLPVLLLAFQSSAQYWVNFNLNNTSAQISANGIFFYDQANNMAAYRPDKYSQVKAIYNMSFSVSAKDQNAQDHLSVTTYNGSDFKCGPIASNYSDTNYINKFANIMWIVNKIYIDEHIQNWNTPSHVVHPSIASWPGNGDVSNGMASKLAPYADVNGNGIYDPENGDYPDIMGDEAVYLIMNDQNNSTYANTNPLNMELHFMFYQYVTADQLNQTNFLNVKAYNRGTQTYTDMKLSVFTDFDLGNYADDFGGTDVSRKLAYVFNGDNMDEANAGVTGYGSNPPAIGMLSLNHSLIASIFPDSIPDPGNEFLNVMNGTQVDGTAITNGGTPTVFHYSDTLITGYNEVALNHAPADKRNFATVSLGTFTPASVKCVDFAWIFARKTTGTSPFKSVDSLLKVADFVQQFYDDMNQCTDGTLQTETLNSGEFNLYPNPSSGLVTCVSDRDMDLVEVWNMEGKLIRTFRVQGKEALLDLNSLSAGAYLVKISGTGETKVKSFYKQ